MAPPPAAADAHPVLYTVAFPELPAEAAAFVARVRGEHGGPQRARIGPHLTLLFGSALLAEPAYRAHVDGIAAEQPAIEFTCRCAMLGSDANGPQAYVFLVPDEGFAAITRLHDALYRGPLAPALRLDIPFIPHITVGAFDDRQAAKALCDRLNADGVQVAGRLGALTVGAMGPDGFVERATLPLGG